jgi:hypothetical protein
LSKPVEDIVAEARRIVDVADHAGLTLRLFGGMAIRFHCPSATHRGLERKYADIDFMGLSKELKALKKLFPELGYTPRQVFNAMYGDKRLIFNDIAQGRRIDIFLDTFEMCHKFDFRKRLEIDNPTISLADLLATKLQVIQITEREYKDIIALMNDHELADRDQPETINIQYLASLCAENWGIYRTFSQTISRVLNALDSTSADIDSEKVKERLTKLQTRMDSVPKSTAWKMRARIGDKKQWYELPEADKEVVDSRMFAQANNPS